MPAFLVPVEPGLCVIPLEKAIVLIGREADCDVSLTQSRKVSRKHCCLAQVNNKIVARDLGSTNGIFLNGARVKKECQVRLGDELVIGDLKFRLQTDPNSVREYPAPEKNPPAVKKPAPETPPSLTDAANKETPVLPSKGKKKPESSADYPVVVAPSVHEKTRPVPPSDDELDEIQELDVEDSLPPPRAVPPLPVKKKPQLNESGPLVPGSYPQRAEEWSDDDVVPLGSDSI